MATKKHSTTKALKAKTPRKRAKPAKKRKAGRAPCPVEAIGRRQFILLKALDEINEKLPKATAGTVPDKGTLEFRQHELWNRCQENRSEASRRFPTSVTGTLFLLGSVMRDLDNLDLNNANDRDLRRRARRSIYAIKRWLGHKWNAAACVDHYLANNNSPHWQLGQATDWQGAARPEGAAS